MKKFICALCAVAALAACASEGAVYKPQAQINFTTNFMMSFCATGPIKSFPKIPMPRV